MRSSAKVAAMIVLVAGAILLSTARVFSEEAVSQPHKGPLASLTSDQKEAVHALVLKMKSENATPEEIHAAVQKTLDGYGIKLPEGWDGRMGTGISGLWSQLTDEQRQALHTKMQALRSQGASREEIGATMKQMLQGNGVNVPEGNFPRMGMGAKGPMASLSDEQKKAIRDKVQALHDQGATREQTISAVKQMLDGYGVKVPDGWQGPWGGAFKGMGANLTGAQRDEIHSKVQEMRGQGATREEIRKAVSDMIASFGATSEASATTALDKGAVPGNTLTAQNFPNPFNPETVISYSTGASANVKVEIFNVTGQLVRSFNQGYRPAGSYAVRWDGHDSGGSSVASGIYFYRVNAGSLVATKKMVMLK